MLCKNVVAGESTDLYSSLYQLSDAKFIDAMAPDKDSDGKLAKLQYLSHEFVAFNPISFDGVSQTVGRFKVFIPPSLTFIRFLFLGTKSFGNLPTIANIVHFQLQSPPDIPILINNIYSTQQFYSHYSDYVAFWNGESIMQHGWNEDITSFPIFTPDFFNKNYPNGVWLYMNVYSSEQVSLEIDTYYGFNATTCTDNTQPYIQDYLDWYQSIGADEWQPNGDPPALNINVSRPMPNPYINVSQIFGKNPLTDIVFSAVSTTSSIKSANWDFGDATSSTERTPSHAYTGVDKENYTVTATVEDTYYKKTYTTSVQVYDNFLPQLSVFPTSIKVGENLNFYGSVLAETGGTAPFLYQWDFGDGANSNVQNPVYSYLNAGKKTVILTVTDANGTSDKIKKEIFVYANFLTKINVNLVPDEPLSCQANQSTPLTKDVSDNSLARQFSPFFSSGIFYPATYSWNFGGNSTSTEREPKHTFKSAGNYLVTLEVTDATGATEKVEKEVKIGNIDDWSVNITMDPNPPIINTEITFTANITGDDPDNFSYVWMIDEVVVQDSITNTMKHLFDSTNNAKVKVTATPKDTQKDPKTADKEVTFKKLQVTITQEPESPSINKVVTFTATVTGGSENYTYTWKVDDLLQESRISDMQKSFTDAGKYLVEVTVTDNNDAGILGIGTKLVTIIDTGCDSWIEKGKIAGEQKCKNDPASCGILPNLGGKTEEQGREDGKTAVESGEYVCPDVATQPSIDSNFNVTIPKILVLLDDGKTLTHYFVKFSLLFEEEDSLWKLDNLELVISSKSNANSTKNTSGEEDPPAECEDEYNNAFAEKETFCGQNPAACGIIVNDNQAYKSGYWQGFYDALTIDKCTDKETLPLFDHDLNITIPKLPIGDATYKCILKYSGSDQTGASTYWSLLEYNVVNE